MSRFWFFSGTLLLTCGAPVSAETSLLELGYRQMYNLEFDQAHRTFRQWGLHDPADPMGPVSEAAAYLFSEFDRLRILQAELFTDDDAFLGWKRPSPDPVLKRDFENALARSGRLAERILADAPRDENALFATVLRWGLHSDYLALIEKRYLASIREMKAGRVAAEKLLAINPECYDAYLAIGIENYVLSLKPAPVRWLLRIGGARTDRAEGVRKLRLTADRGRYLLPFARLLLAVAALRDKDRNGAKKLLQGLVTEFPRNPLYAKELARLR